uniref:guanylate kinase n=1 Tax=Lepeophtheirus salmonis TaxID=72036 RepID=D3PJY1_LEPSM|nr:Guanylate kinase [Lepeophtheirus salmonis]
MIRPLVITGPSGVGKSTLLNALLSKHSNKFSFSVSHTTRQRREGEKDGLHYYFIDKDNFKLKISNKYFLEHAEFANNFYGTSEEEVKKIIDSGKICVLDVEVNGVKSIFDYKPSLNAKYIFVAPPSTELLEERLRGRGTESESKIQARLNTAKEAMDFAYEGKGKDIYDLILVNDDLQKCVLKLEEFLKEDLA